MKRIVNLQSEKKGALVNDELGASANGFQSSIGGGASGELGPLLNISQGSIGTAESHSPENSLEEMRKRRRENYNSVKKLSAQASSNIRAWRVKRGK